MKANGETTSSVGTECRHLPQGGRLSPSVCAQAHSQPPHQRGPRGRGYRKVKYAQSMAEKPTAAQVRAAEERMRQHLIAECDRAGYPVRGFLDTTVRQAGATSSAAARHLSQRGRLSPSVKADGFDSSLVRGSRGVTREGRQGRWIITVTALIEHVV